MAGSPKLKVYDSAGEYIGCVKDATDAAVLVGICGKGDGATVRYAHRLVIWTEGEEHDGLAADSYDMAAEVMVARLAIIGRSISPSTEH